MTPIPGFAHITPQDLLLVLTLTGTAMALGTIIGLALKPHFHRWWKVFLLNQNEAP